MRGVHLTVIVILAMAMVIFAIQNFQSVTVQFLRLSLTAPLALLAAVIYLLGMATGGSIWALVRRAVEGSRRPAAR
jgi:uncharacterized integral membrane protein